MPETRRGILKKVCNMMKDQRSGLRKNQKRIRKGSGKGSGKESEKDREKNQKRIRKNQKGIRKMIRKRRSPVYETRRKQRFPERVTGSGNMFFRSSDRFFQPAVPIIRLNLSDASGQMHSVSCIRSVFFFIAAAGFDVECPVFEREILRGFGERFVSGTDDPAACEEFFDAVGAPAGDS